MNKSFIFVAILCVLFIATFGCSNDKEKGNKNSQTAAASEKTEPAEKKSNWKYREEINKMDETKSYFATIYSIDKDGFRDEKNGFRLVIRNMKNEEDVLLMAPHFGGYFSGESKICRVKFDEDPPQNWSYSKGSSYDLIFLEDSQKFISKLKMAKKIMIGCELRNVERIIEFGNVEGLEWN